MVSETKIDDGTRVRRFELSAASEVDGDFLVLRADTGAVATLNASARCLWESIADDGTTIEQMAEALHGRFGVDAERGLRDTRALVAGLLARGLVVID